MDIEERRNRVEKFHKKVMKYMNEDATKLIDLECPICGSDQIDMTVSNNVDYLYGRNKVIGHEIGDSEVEFSCYRCDYFDQVVICNHDMVIDDEYKDEEVEIPDSAQTTLEALKKTLKG